MITQLQLQDLLQLQPGHRTPRTVSPEENKWPSDKSLIHFIAQSVSKLNHGFFTQKVHLVPAASEYPPRSFKIQSVSREWGSFCCLPKINSPQFWATQTVKQFQITVTNCTCTFLFVLSRQGFCVSTGSPRTSSFRPDCPWTPACLLSAGNKGVHHHSPPCTASLLTLLQVSRVADHLTQGQIQLCPKRQQRVNANQRDAQLCIL